MVLILRIVYNEGFSINPEKTRVARSNARQEVTGIVVNSHMQISKEKRKQIRQQIYYIRKYGLESHLERIDENRANYLNHLLGQINFALFVNPKDEEIKEYFDTVKTIMKIKMNNSLSAYCKCSRRLLFVNIKSHICKNTFTFAKILAREDLICEVRSIT